MQFPFAVYLFLYNRPCVCKITTLISYRNLKTKNPSTCLPCRLFPLCLISYRLVPQSRGSLKVNPRQELCLPPMLVRIQIKKKKIFPSPPKKTTNNQQTDEPRGCGVSVSLASYFLSSLRFPVCSCSVLQKGNCPPSLLLLLSWCSHSPPPIFRSPFER